MRWEVIISLVVMAAWAVNAEEMPSQRPAPGQDASEMDEPALPTSEAAPSNPEAGLLPESGELPARLPAVAPPKSPSMALSTGKTPAEAARFEAIRALAVGDLHATRLLRRARQSSNLASRRSYLRAYYTVVASRMRQLDPKLKASINAYEEDKLGQLSSSRSSTARVSSHRSRIHRPTRLAGHHRWRRYSDEHRYRRFIMIDAPYGPPPFPPYGPPPFPPYGPPMVFEPR
jgi:hypothetical protein